MSQRPTFACVCTACGWRSRRALKNVSRACPKCGGAVVIPKGEERDQAVIVVLLTVVVTVVFAGLLAALKQ